MNITVELMPWTLNDKYYRIYEDGKPAGFIIISNKGATYTCTDPTMLEHVPFNVEWAKAVNDIITAL